MLFRSRAVGADRRLALQRLWRRNREGELPLPAFWPPDLAPLFWPLLLALALALALSLGGWLIGGLRPSRPPTAPPPAGLMEQAERQPAAGTEAGPWGGAAAEPQAPERSKPLQPQAAAPATALEASGPGQGKTSPAASDSVDAGGEGNAAAELRLDPLLELLSSGEELFGSMCDAMAQAKSEIWMAT